MSFALQFFRVLAASTSTMMILSPIPSILKTLRNKHTGVASIVPLVSMFTNCHIAYASRANGSMRLVFTHHFCCLFFRMMYGYLCKLYFPVFSTFIFGDIMCLLYISVFYRFSPEKTKAHRIFVVFGVPLSLLTLYSILGGLGVTGQKAYDVGEVSGYAAIVTTVILYSSPFEKVAMVLKHRSAVFINIHMVCAGTFNNVMWITYTYVAREWLIFIPNIFCCTMGCIQISLYLLFHPRSHPYDGPIPGVTVDRETAIHIELGELSLDGHAITNKTQRESFVVIESPLEPFTGAKY